VGATGGCQGRPRKARRLAQTERSALPPTGLEVTVSAIGIVPAMARSLRPLSGCVRQTLDGLI
jgi:hypothetical protein